MKVVFLNGPPGCGKDTAASFLTKHNIAVVHRKFATAVKRGTHAIFNYPMTCDEAEKRFGREWKDQKQASFMGMSPREAYIWYSEEVMKPKFGNQVFGQMALLDMLDCGAQKIVVFSDSGFDYEAKPVVDYVGAQNCLMVHISRDGCTFDGDSRSYAWIDGVRTIDLNNRFELFMYEMQAVKRIYEWAGLPVPNFD